MILLTPSQKTIYWFNFYKTWFVFERRMRESDNYLHPSPLSGYRPSTRDLQRLLSCASPSILLQVIPSLLMSTWRSRRQVFLSACLFPWGFHDKACRVILETGFHPISFFAGICCVLSQSLMLLIFSGQWIFKILLRQLFMKVCNLLTVVFVNLQVSAPYRISDFMFELKIQTLLCCDSSLELHTFVSAGERPALALPIIALTSASVPPFLSMDAPEIGEGLHPPLAGCQQERLVLLWLHPASLSSFSSCGWWGPLGTRYQ